MNRPPERHRLAVHVLFNNVGGAVGVRANFIHPGRIETPMAMTADGEHFAHKWASAIQLIARPGVPEDIA